MFAKQNLSLHRRLRFLLLSFFVGLPTLCQPPLGRADGLEDAARSLTRKVATALRVVKSLHLEWRNQSSLSEFQSTSLRTAFEEALRSAGVDLEYSADVLGTVTVTIAETAAEVRLVAWITASQLPTVRIVSTPRDAVAPASMGAPSLTLEKQLLLKESERVLDAALLGNPTANQSLLVLETSRLFLYRRQNGQWKLVDAAHIPPVKPWPRDVRGQIFDPEGTLEVRLPGLLCKGAAREKVILDCSQKPEPGGLTPGRNFYPAGPSVTGGTKEPPYYAGADGKDDFSYLELVSGTDGRIYVFRGDGSSVAATFSGWGSDIASLDTECGLKRQILATRTGDRTSPDAVQAYEIHDDRPVAVGAPLEFAGPIMSLQRTADLRTVMVIVRNVETGNYEIYRITLTCSN